MTEILLLLLTVQDNALRFFEPKGACTTEFPLAQVGNITVKPVKKGPEDKKRLIIEFKQQK